MRLPRLTHRIGGRPVPGARLALLLQLAAALFVLGYVLVNQQVRLPWSGGQFTLHAAFSDASGLNPGHRPPVLVAGVDLGHVSSVKYKHGVAIATLVMSDSARGKIHSDASARITPRSAVNDLTVDVAPGTPSAPKLGNGALIPASSNTAPVGLDRVLDVLNADTQSYATVLLQQASVGLGGRTADVRSSLAQLAALLDPTSRVAGALADRRHELSRLVGNLDKVFGTLGRRGSQLQAIVRDGEQTLATAGRRSAELSSSIQSLPSTLASIRDGLDGFAKLAGPLVPALKRLRPFAHALPAAMVALSRFSPDGFGLVRDLGQLAQRGTKPAAALTDLLNELHSSSKALSGPVADLDPIVTSLDKYKSGIAPLGDSFSGVFSTNDVNGPRLRAYGFFEPFNPADMGFGNVQGAALQRAKLQTVEALVRACETTNVTACLVRYLVPGLPGTVVSAIKSIVSKPPTTGRGGR